MLFRRHLSAHFSRGEMQSGSYLCCVLDSIHAVLRAVVVRGAPVEVELAEPVGRSERTTSQHCEPEKLGQHGARTSLTQPCFKQLP